MPAGRRRRGGGGDRGDTEALTDDPTRTLVEALEASSIYEDLGFSHLIDEKRAGDFVSYAELARRARRNAASLVAAGLRRGDRVALIFSESAAFIETLFGCLYAGVIAVPLYPPMNLSRLESYLENTGHVLRRAGCRMVLTDSRVRNLLGRLLDEVPGLTAIETLSWLRERETAGVTEVPPPGPDDVAFLQFTSGSTARPKGVTLTHAHLIANIECIGGALGVARPEPGAGVSWLPLYHDMGLIGFVFTPVYFAVSRIVLIPPLLFLKRPAVWLRQLSETRARFTFAPNFAYGLCARRVKDHEIVGIDLSSLEVAGCGAEPIQRETLESFATRFSAHGFQPTALLPCYGLAEHTLAATFIRRGEGLRHDRVDPDELAQGVARPPASDRSVDVVSCGPSLPDHEILITDDEGRSLPECRVGHIRLRGPSVMRGYWDDPDGTGTALSEGWLSTGDLGYLKIGQLHICGRQKDVIIVNGRKYHPSDIEWLVGQVDGVRRGNVVAFGVMDSAQGRERVVVASEVRDPEPKASLRDEVISRVLEGLTLRVDEVILLPAGSLPKTSSGKLQRSRTAEMFRDGALGAGLDAGALGQIKQLALSQWGFLKARFRAPGAPAEKPRREPAPPRSRDR